MQVRQLFRSFSYVPPIRSLRYASSKQAEECMKHRAGLVLGIYSLNDGKHEYSKFTATAQKFNKKTGYMLESLIRRAGPCPKSGEFRLLYDLDPYFPVVCVVGLGRECNGYDEDEQLDKGKENVREAAGLGSKALIQFEFQRIYLEGLGHPESTAEGAALAIWVYQEYKSAKTRRASIVLELYDNNDWAGWNIGMEKANAQNLARELMEAPSNKSTPLVFAQNAVDILCRSGINVEIKVQNWFECVGMGAFLAVSKGSCESALFLELSYFGAGNFKDRPVVMIGKGVTFDSGGLMLRTKQDMINRRGDLSGAAIVLSVMRAVAALQLPINIRGLIPLCENMPGCSAMKPGDTVKAMNGKTIIIQDTRCEGRLILADALCYAQCFHPRIILDIGTLTKEVESMMSTTASAVFTNSNRLWKHIRISAIHTGDRVWKFPLFRHYGKSFRTSVANVKNVGRPPGMADTCRAAAFLHEFVPCGEWLHIDNFAVSYSEGIHEPSYMNKGMTGRPTRTVVEFISQLCFKSENGEE